MKINPDQVLQDSIVRMYRNLDGDMRKLRELPEDKRLHYIFDWAVANRVPYNQLAMDRLMRTINILWGMRGVTPKQLRSESANKPNMETFIHVAADSIAKLRKQDVYRVLDAAGGQLKDVAKYIVSKRPDLADEVQESIDDLL